MQSPDQIALLYFFLNLFFSIFISFLQHYISRCNGPLAVLEVLETVQSETAVQAGKSILNWLSD